MKKAIIILIVLIVIISAGLIVLYPSMEKKYQQDADLVRLEHLLYWTSLVEEYHDKVGYYPFQKKLVAQEKVGSRTKLGLVRIATKNQRLYFTPGTDKYIRDFDNNSTGQLQEFSVKEFVLELEKGLERKIEEKYDVQKIPTRHVVVYQYYITDDGYLMWVPCITCGVTPISTLLMYGGFPPTVNIVSDGMVGKVTKALTRENMINHLIFKNWQNRGYLNEQNIRHQEQRNLHDLKQE